MNFNDVNFDKGQLEIAVVGLGYVGLPLAIEFSKKYKVIGFDLSENRINEIINGYDRTKSVSQDDLRNSDNLKLVFSTKTLSSANIFIITVPTPVTFDNKPDLSYLKQASITVGKVLKKKDIVIYESTVFPGCTEEICVPILEKFSGLIFNKDFYCGYSPERINPGDKNHTLIDIVKITSGSSIDSAEFIDSLYKSIIKAGTYKASSIKIAEAAKVIENTQRDINIALINELAIIFDHLSLDTLEVLEAAGSKWNFLPFRPGFVGGHCIGIDPYYLTYKSKQVGYNPEVILSGRKTNDKMPEFIIQKIIFELKHKNLNAADAKISVLGLSFKENCPDMRNSKILLVIQKLKDLNCKLKVSDYCVDKIEAQENYKINLISDSKITSQDIVVVSIGHSRFKKFEKESLLKMLKPKGLLIDIKSLYQQDLFHDNEINHWRL